MTDLWRPLDEALARCEAQGRSVNVWLRDDDAVAATPALERLASLCETHRMPALLAVIPNKADASLTRLLAGQAWLAPTQHGFAHVNHAADGERARELGGTRALADVLSDLECGRAKLQNLFGAKLRDILVPPWNRIDDVVVDQLAGFGYRALSTFGQDERGRPALARLNCDLDIIDWRNGRKGHDPAKLVGKLAALISDRQATPQPLGLLTHHLVHDDGAWLFLDQCLERLSCHPVVRFVAADTVLDN